MFDSLSDQMKADERLQTSGRERMIRYVIIAVLSILVFVGLYLAVRMAS